jgi:hypothetical protein
MPGGWRDKRGGSVWQLLAKGQPWRRNLQVFRGRKFRADMDPMVSKNTLRLNLGGSSDVKIRDSASADHLHPRVRST